MCSWKVKPTLLFPIKNYEKILLLHLAASCAFVHAVASATNHGMYVCSVCIIAKKR